MTTTLKAGAEVVYRRKPRLAAYLLLTAAPALIAAVAVFATASLGGEPWLMFLGWVAFFTRPSPSDSLQTFVCLVIGLTLGALATAATGAVAPMVGAAALPVVTFGVALTVIATRGLPVLNNLLGYFIGLIAFFAAHEPPSLGAVSVSALTAAIGFIAGAVSQVVGRAIAPAG